MQHHYHVLPDGLRLHYTSWGQHTSPAVVCVHGLTRNARDFDVLAASLSDQFYVLCIDVVGRGESDWAPEPSMYNVLSYAHQLNHLLDALQLQSPHWVGTSMGGLIALTLQAIQPGRFAKLVLNDVGPVVEQVALQRISQYIGARTRFSNRFEAVDYAKTVFASFGAQTDAQWAALTDYYFVDQADGTVCVHYDPAISAVVKQTVADMTTKTIQAGEAFLWNSLATLSQPCLVLRGEYSDLLTIATTHDMQQANPNVSIATIQGCGHAPHLLDAIQTNLVKDFLL